MFGGKKKKVEESTTKITNIGKQLKVIVRYPRDFNAAQECADMLMEGNIIIANLEYMHKADQNRFFDYMNGVEAVCGGNVGSITEPVLIYVPEDVKLDYAGSDEEDEDED